MPARNKTVADSLRNRLRSYFATHPGWHKAPDVADDLGITDPTARRDVQIEISRLARSQDSVVSYRPATAGKRGPGTLFARPLTPVPEETQKT